MLRDRPLFASPAFVAGAVAALLGAACTLPPPPVTEDPDDPWVHRTMTAWQPLPSKDGSRLALALEPRRVDADTHGVMITGWHGRVAGDGVVVVPSEAGPAVVATVPRGFLDADLDADAVFVWTKAASTWTPVAPNDRPPSARYAAVTWLDRETFAVSGTRTFDPPLEMPIAVGGARVLDTPAPGASDVEREVRIALHDLVTGSIDLYHSDRGFAVSTCARGSAVTVAYQSGTDKTVVVDVAVDAGRARVARLDLDDFLADAVTCRRDGRHVAMLGGRPSDREGRAVVLAREDDALSVVFESSVGVPAVLSLDGTTLLATGPDHGAMLVTKSGARPLPGVRTSNDGRLVVSGDRAIVGGDGVWSLVRLDGTEPRATRVSIGGDASPNEVFAAGPRGFLAFAATNGATRVFTLDGAGAASEIARLPYERPSLAWADAGHAWIVGDRAADRVDLVGIDLAAKQVSKTLPFPLCDRVAMRTKERCFP